MDHGYICFSWRLEKKNKKKTIVSESLRFFWQQLILVSWTVWAFKHCSSKQPSCISLWIPSSTGCVTHHMFMSNQINHSKQFEVEHCLAQLPHSNKGHRFCLTGGLSVWTLHASSVHQGVREGANICLSPCGPGMDLKPQGVPDILHNNCKK